MVKKRHSLQYDARVVSDSAHHVRRKALVRETEGPGYVATSRTRDFSQIAASIDPHIVFSAQLALVAEGDSLALLRKLPQHSVSLILTDPPYHATKKQNIYGDRAFAEDQHYLDWMADYATEWHRVLRPNGSLFCFCDSSMAGRLEVLFSKYFNILSHVVWTKPNDPGFDGCVMGRAKPAS